MEVLLTFLLQRVVPTFAINYLERNIFLIILYPSLEVSSAMKEICSESQTATHLSNGYYLHRDESKIKMFDNCSTYHEHQGSIMYSWPVCISATLFASLCRWLFQINKKYKRPTLNMIVICCLFHQIKTRNINDPFDIQIYFLEKLLEGL